MEREGTEWESNPKFYLKSSNWSLTKVRLGFFKESFNDF